MTTQNLLRVYFEATTWERSRGMIYYDHQREKILQWTEELQLPVENKVGAFCVLTPNNSERTTYRDLYVCVDIVLGRRPENTGVGSWPVNKTKALRLLRGEDPASVIGGRKVTAFYYNTLNPEDSSHVTIDGHLYGCWKGTRVLMRNVPYLGKGVYEEISNDLRSAAAKVGIPAPKFQSTLWITWKRIHQVLHKPQLDFGVF